MIFCVFCVCFFVFFQNLFLWETQAVNTKPENHPHSLRLWVVLYKWGINRKHILRSTIFEKKIFEKKEFRFETFIFNDNKYMVTDLFIYFYNQKLTWSKNGHNSFVSGRNFINFDIFHIYTFSSSSCSWSGLTYFAISRQICMQTPWFRAFLCVFCCFSMYNPESGWYRTKECE